MDRKRRENLLLIHESFADSIIKQLIRVWQRPLTSDEINAVKDGMLCQSLMSIESIERGLLSTDDVEKTISEFEFIRLQAEKYRDKVIIEVRKGLRGIASNLPEPAAFPNLIEWERALLNHCE